MDTSEELYVDTTLQFDSSINESLLEELTLAALELDEDVD